MLRRKGVKKIPKHDKLKVFYGYPNEIERLFNTWAERCTNCQIQQVLAIVDPSFDKVHASAVILLVFYRDWE